MAISPEQLAQIIGHNSKTLCSAKGQKKLNEMAGAMNFDNPDQVSDEWDNWNFDDPNTPQMQQPQVQNKQPYYNQPVNENVLANSRLPDAIKQSFAQNYIDTSALGQGLGDTSFLDNVAQQRKQQVNETYVPTQTTGPVQYTQPQQYQAQPQYPMGIDYNYLKHIISECIAEYFSKQPLNEQATLKTIGLSEGKIKLVDNKGNVYGATLEFKGNMEDRKKK